MIISSALGHKAGSGQPYTEESTHHAGALRQCVRSCVLHAREHARHNFMTVSFLEARAPRTRARTSTMLASPRVRQYACSVIPISMPGIPEVTVAASSLCTSERCWSQDRTQRAGVGCGIRYNASSLFRSSYEHGRAGYWEHGCAPRRMCERRNSPGQRGSGAE